MSQEGKASGRVQALESELAGLKAALAQTAAARDDALAAAGELALLQEEYEVLRAEYTLINQELADRSAELLQVRSENEAAQEAAAADLAGLRSELERFTSTQRDGFPPLAATGAADAEVVRAPSQVTAEPSQWDSSGFPSTDEEIFFRLDHSLSAIPCDSPEDVIELRVSVNAIRLSGDHSNCSAYICGIRRDGGQEVYVALHQLDNDRSLIYVPSRQSVTPEEYERVMESAIEFSDLTGFIINLVHLGSSAEARAEALRKIPVFSSR